MSDRTVALIEKYHHVFYGKNATSFNQVLGEFAAELRAQDAAQTILVVSKRSDDYHVCLKGNKGVWAAGKTIDDALGNWLRTHRANANFEIEYDGSCRRH